MVVIPDFLLWVDIETTGLDPHRDIMLEFAAVVTRTGPDMDRLWEWETLVAPRSRPAFVAAVSGMRPEVDEMHARSGLVPHGNPDRVWEMFDAGHPTLGHVESVVSREMRRFGDGAVWMMAGSGVQGFDRQWIATQMPRVDALLHYRCLDVSAIRTALAIAGDTPPLLDGWDDPPAHRAMPDVRRAMTEWQRYRWMLRYATSG